LLALVVVPFRGGRGRRALDAAPGRSSVLVAVCARQARLIPFPERSVALAPNLAERTARPQTSVTSSGARFMLSRLRELPRRPRARCVFDLDNTLFDTRHRTLALARAFDREHETTCFARLTLARVGRDAAQTCERARMSLETSEHFQREWLEGFWRAENFALDRPIPSMIRWVWRAREAGAEIVFLTGRLRRYRRATLDQLERAGLRFVRAGDVRHKPRLSLRTTDFKARALAEILRDGFLGWYVTESRREIGFLQAALPGAPLVLLGSRLEPKAHRIARGTPQLPAVM
jgi:hypothetical protein